VVIGIVFPTSNIEPGPPSLSFIDEREIISRFCVRDEKKIYLREWVVFY
jgi:hypothetical protein